MGVHALILTALLSAPATAAIVCETEAKAFHVAELSFNATVKGETRYPVRDAGFLSASAQHFVEQLPALSPCEAEGVAPASVPFCGTVSASLMLSQFFLFAWSQNDTGFPQDALAYLEETDFDYPRRAVEWTNCLGLALADLGAPELLIRHNEYNSTIREGFRANFGIELNLEEVKAQ
ncbi:hypothetical protein [uncultured Roseobacter sp.]|uniref:hypothetical protein n=1 Tax=uncultured Roseobacter sp. TaxID=114847 RepID=UPI00260B3912|nr:hypothetical protein [uncultured Roseobacter sp.]